MMGDPLYADYAEGLVLDPYWFDDDFIEAVNTIADRLPGKVWTAPDETTADPLTRRRGEAKRMMQEMAARTKERKTK